jgi:nucleotide-binding universal stress UspA family protein
MTNTIAKSSKIVLCPTDFSPSSEQALLHAAGNLSGNVELIVLHVGKGGSSDQGTLLREHLHHFSRYSDILSTYGCRVRFAVEYGSPATVITSYVRKIGASMIVMGSHGTSDIRRLLVGSTTESVMRHASCPVLVLRSPENSREAVSADTVSVEVLSNTND